MKVILIYSGGMDSTTLLYQFRHWGTHVRCLGIDYGQRHQKELKAATRICGEVGVEYKIADLTSLKPFLSGSSQTSDDIAVPEGHYTHESMKLTVIPNRNMLMISVAVAWAISTESNAVAYAAHTGDHAIYPDCRKEFVAQLGKAINLCSWSNIDLMGPFLDKTKAEIVKLGKSFGVPFEQTWSCYKGQEIHCGKCGTCVERREAFELANIDDPTQYEV